MPSLGIGEILLIIIAVVLFVQPKDFPKLLNTFGNVYAEIQRQLAKFKYYTHDTLNTISNLDNIEISHPSQTISKKSQNNPESHNVHTECDGENK